MKYEKLDAIKDFIKPDDFTGDLRIIAIKCGVQVTLDLYEEFKGLNIYFPENAINRAKERYIAENCDGSVASIRELVRKVSISERHIRKILDKKVSEVRQTSIFDCIDS